MPQDIFVFGSNEAGIHGSGAAYYAAEHHGAERGQGFGLAGTSFAIPTKDWMIETLPLPTIEFYVQRFIAYAQRVQSFTFIITRIGCGLAGYKDAQIAPMFNGAPGNCKYDTLWKPYLLDISPNPKNFWGTYA